MKINSNNDIYEERNAEVINYAQCWEDPDSLLKALDVNQNDDVLSICSGGDNSLALLLQDPKSITIIDCNPTQLILLDLKIKAIQNLSYNEFIGFIGVAECNNRIELYTRIRSLLCTNAGKFWDGRMNDIAAGIIHSGKFERFFNLFRRSILPLIHSIDTVNELLSCSSLESQRQFYDSFWNNLRWRTLLKIFFSRFVMGRVGRDPSFYKHVDLRNTSDEILRRTHHGFRDIEISTNYFAEYILKGNYSNLQNIHPYLMKSHFNKLKANCGRVNIVQGSLTDYLTTLQNNSLSKLNLSDIFEYMSQEEFESSLKEISRVLRRGSKLSFWTLFVKRNVPKDFRNIFYYDKEVSEKIYASSRTFFYGSFNLWQMV